VRADVVDRLLRGQEFEDSLLCRRDRLAEHPLLQNEPQTLRPRPEHPGVGVAVERALCSGAPMPSLLELAALRVDLTGDERTENELSLEEVGHPIEKAGDDGLVGHPSARQA